MEKSNVFGNQLDKENQVVSSKKLIFSLYPFTETLENAILRLKKIFPSHMIFLETTWTCAQWLPLWITKWTLKWNTGKLLQAWHIPVTNRPLPYIPCVLNTWMMMMMEYFTRVGLSASGGLWSKRVWNILWDDPSKHQTLETFQWWMRFPILVSLCGCKHGEDALETLPRKHYLRQIWSQKREKYQRHICFHC